MLAAPSPPLNTPSDLDATRARLLEAAGEVFAEQGFQAATVREICARAGANVAAVNYHFRDKMGLYAAAIAESPEGLIHGELNRSAQAIESPSKALQFVITGMLNRILSTTETTACHIHVMAHELAHPTTGLDLVIEKVIGPKYAQFRQIISRIIGLPPDHDTTRLCAHSVIAQVVHYAHARPVITRIWPELTFTEDRIEQIAQHITTFSLAALRSTSKRAQAQKEPKPNKRTPRK